MNNEKLTYFDVFISYKSEYCRKEIELFDYKRLCYS
jgi:hypothetical protein